MCQCGNVSMCECGNESISQLVNVAMSRFEDLKIQHSIFHVQHSLFNDRKVKSKE